MTPAQMLVDAVGEDRAISVMLWLTDISDLHALEVGGKPISPSVEWLLDSLRHGLGLLLNDGDAS